MILKQKCCFSHNALQAYLQSKLHQFLLEHISIPKLWFHGIQVAGKTLPVVAAFYLCLNQAQAASVTSPATHPAMPARHCWLPAHLCLPNQKIKHPLPHVWSLASGFEEMKIYRDRERIFVSNENQTLLKCQHLHAEKRRNGKTRNKFCRYLWEKVGQAFASCYLAHKYCMVGLGSHWFCVSTGPKGSTMAESSAAHKAHTELGHQASCRELTSGTGFKSFRSS